MTVLETVRDSFRERWGKPALGHRTRNNKATDRMIVRRRKK